MAPAAPAHYDLRSQLSVGVSSQIGSKSFKHLAAIASSVLYEQWDPIGVGAAGGPSDEYESYVPALIGLVRSGASDEVIAEHLGSLERTAMGVAVSPAAHRLAVVRRVRAAVREAGSVPPAS